MNNQDRPLISIIMNCHNSAKFLKEAIESVLNQTYTNWELIFWDNLSTDESAKILKSYDDCRIKYFISKEFTSLGKARNFAINQSKGRFIAFLDCDDLWHPEKLSKQIPLFKDQEVGIVISNTIFFGENYRSKVLYKNPPPQGYVFKELLEAYFISLETAIIRMSALKSLDSMFDERFEVIEEFDLFIRLSKSYKLAYSNHVLGKWRIHSNSLTWTKKELFTKESYLLIEKINNTFPEIRKELKKSILKFELKINYQEFLILWENNNLRQNRKIFYKKFFKSKKFIFVFLISFFLSFKNFEVLKRYFKY